MTLTTLDDLFARGMRQLHAAHHRAADLASRSHQAAFAPRLRDAMRDAAAAHLAQAERIGEVLATIGPPLADEADRDMAGIVDDGAAVTAAMTRSPALDQELIRSGRIAAHHLLAQHATLRDYAKALGHRRAARMLRRGLREVSAADARLDTLGADLRQSVAGLAVRFGAVAAGLVAGGVLLFPPARLRGAADRRGRPVPTYPFPDTDAGTDTAPR